ncbi:MAG: hypothetical protein ACXVDA_16000 [Ktedonobacterales bacterium]
MGTGNSSTRTERVALAMVSLTSRATTLMSYAPVGPFSGTVILAE